MPFMNGFEVVQKISGSHLPAIVIVTAYHQHAIQAFEAGAIDYLLKPVSAVRLRQAVERARSLLNRPLETAANLGPIAAACDANGITASRKLIGRAGRDYFVLDAGEVLAMQAEKEVVWLITAEDRFLSHQSLRALEKELRNSSFQRVHRNAIVNVDHVRRISPLSNRRWILTLSNDTQLVASKRQARNIRRLLRP